MPTHKLTFLGIQINGTNKTLTVPDSKKIEATNKLRHVVGRRTATVKELESLAGSLNFISRVIIPGRAFTRRMYAKFSKVKEILKKHHHVTLDQEFKSDCKMWLTFMDNCENTRIARPFIDSVEAD